MTNELEWQTRRERINRRLTNLNPPWTVVKYKENMDTSSLVCHAVEEYPTANGPADYALFVKGKLLGILEAKKVGVNPQNVLEQAKRYSRGAFNGVGNWEGYRVPFLYSSNGEIIWFLDVRDNKNIRRQIAHFHTANALEEFLKDDRSQRLKWLKDNPIDIERLRYYQKGAIEAIEEAIIQHKRAMLVAMATGTGKTYTMVAQVYRLLQSRAARRILFLVDRRALAAQAVREFASFNTPRGNKFDKEYEVYSQRFHREDLDDDKPFDPNILPNEYLTSPRESHTFVYVSTIQRMAINLFGREQAFSQDINDPDYEEDAERLNIPIHAFDLVIADECHRGYTAKDTAVWRGVLEHFDAIKIGLTATPAVHTLSLFNEVVYRYTTEQAIQDGYLVDYEAVKIKYNVKMNGVFLKEGDPVGIIDTTTGVEIYDELEDEREFSSEEIELKITAPESNRKIIKEIAKYAYEHEKEAGRFPKTLIFAVNDLPHTSHADQIVRLCREEFQQGDDFVQKITGSPSVDRPLQKIREFRNRPNPKIVVTVDMLSTGVDIPSLEFVVFLRPVKSRILWIQMLGRGTRLCPEINKESFKIFDCFDGTLIEYFKNTTDFKIELPEKEPLSIKQVIENIYQNVDRDYYIKVLVKRLRRIDRTMSGDARERFAVFISDGDIGRFADELPQRLKRDFANTLNLLRDERFQDLLLNYPRAKRGFLVGYSIPDDVTSEVMIRKGKEYQKPEDYLISFARFVKENKEEIEAVQILLERPKEWKTEVLNDLRKTLMTNDFSENELQIEPKIYLGDSIYESNRGEQYNCVLTNPPFGTKGANQAPERDDFTIATSNKQLNFVQHVINILKRGGRAAIVLPDNCLFEDKAGEVFEILMHDCNLHTILRLPRGTFTPYSPGVKANVIFFQKGIPTEDVGIFDARSNVSGITKKERPLTRTHFEEFERCHGKDPNGQGKRQDMGKEGRFRRFHISDIKEHDYKLDITWLKDETIEDAENLPEPQDLATEAITELEAVVDDLKEILQLIETNGENSNG